MDETTDFGEEPACGRCSDVYCDGYCYDDECPDDDDDCDFDDYCDWELDDPNI